MEVVLAFVLRDLVLNAVDNERCVLNSVSRTSYDCTVVSAVAHILIKALAAEHDVCRLAVLIRYDKIGDNCAVCNNRSLITAIDGNCELLSLKIGIAY